MVDVGRDALGLSGAGDDEGGEGLVEEVAGEGGLVARAGLPDLVPTRLLHGP